MDQQVHKCNKEDKIDEMEKKITLLDRVVIQGTNGDSLITMAKKSIDNQKEMDDKLWIVDSNVIGLMKFQVKMETERDMKQAIRDRKAKRQQWFISLLVGSVIALGGLLIAALKMNGS